MSDRDRHALSELSREELILENRSRMVQGVRDSWLNRCQCIIRPFQVPSSEMLNWETRVWEGENKECIHVKKSCMMLGKCALIRPLFFSLPFPTRLSLDLQEQL